MKKIKTLFGNGRENEQIFYTSEGVPYTLNRAFKSLPGVVLPGGTADVTLVAVFNPQNSLSNWFTVSPYGSLLIDQSINPVVPLMMNYMAVLGTGALTPSTVANLQLPYYGFQREFSLVSPDRENVKPLMKCNPLVNFVKADPPTGTLVYGLKYDQIVLSSDDFIQIQGSGAFIFAQSAANAYTGRHNPFTITSGGFPVDIVQSLLYFELQK